MGEPICALSEKTCNKICINLGCMQSAFICKYCQNQQCQNRHNHDGQLKTIKWQSMNKLIYEATHRNSLEVKENIKKLEKEFQNIWVQFHNCLSKYAERCQQNSKALIIDKQVKHIANSLKSGKFNQLKGKDMGTLYQKIKSNSYAFNIPEVQRKNKQQTLFLYKAIHRITNTLQDYQRAYQLKWSKQDNEKLLKYNKKIKQNRTDPTPYFGRGCLYYKYNQLQKALFDFNKSIQFDPKNPSAYYNRGLVYKDKDQIQKALADYNKAIQYNPNFSSAYNNRGVIFKIKNQITQALEDYNKAIQCNPKDASAYYNRGCLYIHQNEIDKAIKDFSTTIQYNNDYAQAYYNRGCLYKDRNELDKALEDLNQAIQIDNRYACAYYNRATIYKLENKIQKALLDYSMAIQCDPSDHLAFYNRGILFQMKNMLNYALKDYTRVIELNGDLKNAYINREKIYRRLGRQKEAQQDEKQLKRLKK